MTGLWLGDSGGGSLTNGVEVKSETSCSATPRTSTNECPQPLRSLMHICNAQMDAGEQRATRVVVSGECGIARSQEEVNVACRRVVVVLAAL